MTSLEYSTHSLSSVAKLGMSVLRLPHLLLVLEGVHGLVPGLIHSFKHDGGAQSIAGFTNYEKSKAEILWAFRIIGQYSNIHLSEN